MEILELQIIFMVSILCGTLLFCLIPLLVLRRRASVALSAGSQRILSCLSCVAGGVFIAMCFLGLMPFVQEKMDLVLAELHFKTHFPVAESVVVLGFFLILTIEQLIVACRKGRGNSGSRKTSEVELRSSTKDADAFQKLLEADELDNGDQDVVFELNPVHGNPIGGGGGGGGSGASGVGTASSRKGKSSQLWNGTTASTNSPARYAPVSSKNEEDDSCGHHRNMIALTGQKIGLRFAVLVLALSIHAVFEGLALGLQKDKEKAMHLFLGIILHESLCSLALGINTAKLRLSVCSSLKYLLFFCIMLPAGIGAGIFIGRTPGLVGNIFSGVLQGLAAGIFLHVTFMEIIPGEFSNNKDGLLKVLFLFIGFHILAAIKLAQELRHF